MNMNLKKAENSSLSSGVLGVCIKRAFNIDLSNVPSGSNSIKWNYLIVKLQLNNIRRESKAFKIDFLKNECLFDDLKHLQVKVDTDKNNIKNQLMIELLLIGYDTKNTEKCSKTIGNHYINIVDLIRVGTIDTTFEMKHYFKTKCSYACMLNLEFSFAYGLFGYGYSNQLKPIKDFYCFETPAEFLAHSMFQRVEPPEFR